MCCSVCVLVLGVHSITLWRRGNHTPTMSEAQLKQVSSGRDKGEMDELKVGKTASVCVSFGGQCYGTYSVGDPLQLVGITASRIGALNRSVERRDLLKSGGMVCRLDSGIGTSLISSAVPM